jgi:hypothetical protein
MDAKRLERESARDREDDDSSVRSLPDLDARVMEIDLAGIEQQLRTEDRWHTSGRNAATLVKYPDVRLVLEVMRPGASIDETRVERDARVVIQVLSGRLRLTVDQRTLELFPGRIFALDHLLPEHIEPLEETTYLIWVSRGER